MNSHCENTIRKTREIKVILNQVPRGCQVFIWILTKSGEGDGILEREEEEASREEFIKSTRGQ